MAELVIALVGALGLFLIRRYLFRRYVNGQLPVWVPAFAFALVWASLPIAGVVAGLWPLDLVLVALSVSALFVFGAIMLWLLPRLAESRRRQSR